MAGPLCITTLFYLNSFGCFLSQKNNHLVLIAIKKKMISLNDAKEKYVLLLLGQL